MSSFEKLKAAEIRACLGLFWNPHYGNHTGDKIQYYTNCNGPRHNLLLASSRLQLTPISATKILGSRPLSLFSTTTTLNIPKNSSRLNVQSFLEQNPFEIKDYQLIL